MNYPITSQIPIWFINRNILYYDSLYGQTIKKYFNYKYCSTIILD